MAGIYQSSFTGSEIDNIVSSSLLGVNVNGTPASITNRIAEINIPEYSSGTWAPSIGNYGSGVRAPSISGFDHRYGNYVRFGTLCYINFSIKFTLTSGGNGYAMIATLPFAASTSIFRQSVSLCELGGFKGNDFWVPEQVPTFYIEGASSENTIIKIREKNGIYGMQWPNDGTYVISISGSGIYEIQI